MHVAMLTNSTAPDKLGGLERYVTELSQHLVALDVQVTVIAKARDTSVPLDETGSDGVRILRYPMPTKSDPLFASKYPIAVARGVKGALQQAAVTDVVHCHFAVPSIVPAWSRRPYVYTFHAPVWREMLVERQGSYRLPRPIQPMARAGLRTAERQVLKRARHIITLSEFMRAEVTHLDRSVGRRVQVLPGGIDTTRFKPAASDETSQAPGLRLFTARRLVPRTGVGELIEAMPEILQTFPQAHLEVAGEGMQRRAIEAKISALGLANAVTLLGRVTDAELIDSYRRADLAITPTQDLEGFGLSTAEALACGTPCLVTPAGANPEVVRELSPALVTRDTSPHALAQGVIGWFTQTRPVGSLVDECRRVVEPELSWPSIARAHLDVYRATR